MRVEEQEVQREPQSPSPCSADTVIVGNINSEESAHIYKEQQQQQIYFCKKEVLLEPKNQIMGNCINCCESKETTTQDQQLHCANANIGNNILAVKSKKLFSSLSFVRITLQETLKQLWSHNNNKHQEDIHCHHIKQLLHDCDTPAQHTEKVNQYLLISKSQHGSMGLKSIGFEYRLNGDGKTKLYHIETNTCITEENRHQYIADGCMYEEVARLAQETAQEYMIREGNLQWIDVCDDGNPGIRALISTSFSDDSDHPTFLVTTGKGKVRAGIFSRKHLIVTGLEASTALSHLIEAKRRNMRIVMLDPNARGDRFGMDTFEISMKRIFNCTANDLHKIFVLAHSQAGAQLVRYLLNETTDNFQNLHVKAIAFTDSTHNIQWTKTNPSLSGLLSGKTSIYLKSTTTATTATTAYNKYNPDNMEDNNAGTELDTDNFWKHRFGEVRTLSAGTAIHELVNWTGRKCIWKHFDDHLTE